MKKIWIAGIACIALLGITIPVVASNFAQEEKQEEEIGRASCRERV